MINIQTDPIITYIVHKHLKIILWLLNHTKQICHITSVPAMKSNFLVNFNVKLFMSDALLIEQILIWYMQQIMKITGEKESLWHLLLW